MKSLAVTVALAASLAARGASASPPDRYALPHSKLNLEPCRKAALARHPGAIQEFRILHRDRAVYLRYEILELAGTEWLVLCDGLTGEIIRDIALDQF